ncbi:hypothetical protein, partial [Cellulomonas iranensis]|uniref:hypothetical protein n=1 Tax=Cellulomonas iranensis TaxID=76862 RepID=UPI001C4FD43F
MQNRSLLQVRKPRYPLNARLTGASALPLAIGRKAQAILAFTLDLIKKRIGIEQKLFESRFLLRPDPANTDA